MRRKTRINPNWLRRFIVIISLSLFAFWAQAQSITISGYISDASIGERLTGVNVVGLGQGFAVSSNFYGFYSVKAPIGKVTLMATMLGYKTDTLSFSTQNDTLININLSLDTEQLASVQVTAKRVTILDIRSHNRISLSRDQINSLPQLLGETDVIKAMTTLPGVRLGREGSSEMIVRGGGPDQNLILLDGVPIYNSAHTLGLFSVFNADVIKKSEIIKGGFPARFGGRLSSVLDIQLKDGNSQRYRNEFTIGLLSSKLLFEGPLGNENTTFVIAGRRTYLDLLAGAIQLIKGSESKASYNFGDLNAKITHKFSNRDRLYFSLYAGQDRLGMTEKDETDPDYKEKFVLKWGNITSALRLNHLFSDKLFSNTTLTFSNYNFKINGEEKNKVEEQINKQNISFISLIRDLGLKVDFDYFPSNNHRVRFGLNSTFHTFKPNVLKANTLNRGQEGLDTALYDQPIRAIDSYIYLEDEMQLGPHLQVNAGLHLANFNVRGKNYFSLQPRLSANLLLGEKMAFRASYATMEQNIHLLSNTFGGSPTDIWVPSTDVIRPEKLWMATVGLARTLDRGQFELSVDGYYKSMDRVIEFLPGADFFSSGPDSEYYIDASQNWETRLTKGTGRNYGAELLLQKLSGKITGRFGYTLSWAKRTFPALNKGLPFPYRYDSRHNIEWVASYKPSERIKLSAAWNYRTGSPVTLVTGQYKPYIEASPLPGVDPYHPPIDFYPFRNNYRMRDYHRLDFSISFIKQKKKGERTWNISIYNAYNRKNPYYVELDEINENGTASIGEVSIFQIIPSVSYSFKFY